MEHQLQNLKVPELLQRYVEIIEELKRQGVLRTENNPVGDYAEWLVAQRLNLQLRGNSYAGYDAIDGEGLRYQIKSRRLNPANMSTQLGAIRDLDKQHFDQLIGIIFNADFSVQQVVKIPHFVISDYARYVPHTNSHRLHLKGPLLIDSRAEDITHLFVEASQG